jgi:hypothetical protein
MKAAKKRKRQRSWLAYTGTVLFLHPMPDTYEQLSRPVTVDDGTQLIAGEIGVIDCGFVIRTTPNA